MALLGQRYRYPTNMTERKHNARLIWWISAAAVVGVLFLRGHYLLGPFVGVVFAIMTLSIAVIGYRNLCLQTPTRSAVALFSVFAIACTAIMFTPASFSPDVQHSINKYRDDRNAQTELAALLGANQDYRDIRIETEQLKVVFVSVRGTVSDSGVIARLLTELSRLEFVRYRSLHGRVIARDTGAIHEFSNDDLQFDKEHDPGNHVMQRRTGGSFSRLLASRSPVLADH